MIGGAERMSLYFLSRANTTRFDYHIVSLLGDGSLTRRCIQDGFPALNISQSDSFLEYPHQFFSVLSYCKQHRFDLIQTFGLRADVIGRIVARLIRIPVVISSIRSPDPWRKPWHIFIDDFTAGIVDLFISNSEAGRLTRIQREHFPADKIITIHNGVEIPDIPGVEQRINLRSKFSQKINPFIITVLANFRKMKGHEDIVRAAEMLVDEIPGLVFVFAGEGPLKRHIRNLVEKRPTLLDIIQFPGLLEQPLELLHASDIFLLTSRWEGCPASVLEAMAAELPVIATNVGGIPELVQHGVNGVLIPPRDPEAIADAVLHLYRHSEDRHRMARSARKTVEEHFTLEAMTRAIESQYERLLSIKGIL